VSEEGRGEVWGGRFFSKGVTRKEKCVSSLIKSWGKVLGRKGITTPLTGKYFPKEGDNV